MNSLQTNTKTYSSEQLSVTSQLPRSPNYEREFMTAKTPSASNILVFTIAILALTKYSKTLIEAITQLIEVIVKNKR